MLLKRGNIHNISLSGKNWSLSKMPGKETCKLLHYKISRNLWPGASVIQAEKDYMQKKNKWHPREEPSLLSVWALSLGLSAIRVMPEGMGSREASSSGGGAKTPWHQLGALRGTLGWTQTWRCGEVVQATLGEESHKATDGSALKEGRTSGQRGNDRQWNEHGCEPNHLVRISAQSLLTAGRCPSIYVYVYTYMYMYMYTYMYIHTYYMEKWYSTLVILCLLHLI